MKSRKSVLAGIGALAIVALTAAPASAHVTVNPKSVAQGSYSLLTFRMPDEEDSANAVKLEVDIPIDNPIASVSVEPKPGWSYTTQTSKLATPITTDDGQVTEAISQIVWTATDGGLKPGEFGQFNISAGPLPKTGSIVFKAIQTYSNGDVVRWIDPTVAGQAEPEHPAPVLTLTAASSSDTSSTSTGAAVTASTHYAKHSTAVAALTVGIIGLALAVIGLVTALVAISKKKA